MNKNTLYIQEIADILLIVNIDGIKKVQSRALREFESRCLEEFTTMKGRMDAIKAIFKLSYNIPIYINDKMIFIKICNQKRIWINGINVVEVIKDNKGTKIIFKNGLDLKIDRGYRSINGLLNKVKEIINYKNDFI